MAVNNNGNRVDTSGNVAVDFVWGGMLPMQPNDERADSQTAVASYDQVTSPPSDINARVGDKGWTAVGTFKSGRLDFTKGNHAVVEADYAGFPGFTGNNDGAYINKVAFVSVPSVLGFTTALAVDALKDSGLTVATATAATNTTKVLTTVDRPAGSKNLVFTITSLAGAYPVGSKIAVSNFSGGDAVLNGTYTVTAAGVSTVTVQTTETTAVALSGKTAAVAGVSGTIKSQDTAAGADSVDAGASVTITPFA